MTNASACGATSPCDTSVAERPRYYPRQIITPDDLTLEQDYFRNKFRRHNRLMHGWGVVCGAKVCVTPISVTADNIASYQPWMVTVTSGYVLGPYGDEIILDCCRAIDVRIGATTGVTGDPCVQASDPWCTDVYQPRTANAPLYIAVKYKECRSRPVRVQPMGCGCNDNTCEYSRLQDGYEIGVLTSCPDGDTPPPNLDQLGQTGTPDCPPCPSEPWVVLAQVVVGADGTILSIDNCKCRRIVISFGNYWFGCNSNGLQVASISGATPAVNPQAISQGAQNVATTVVIQTAAGVTQPPVLKADLGVGVTVASFTPGATMADPYSLIFSVAATAAVGPRTLTVTSADGASEASLENAIGIVAASAAPAVSEIRTANTGATDVSGEGSRKATKSNSPAGAPESVPAAPRKAVKAAGVSDKKG